MKRPSPISLDVTGDGKSAPSSPVSLHQLARRGWAPVKGAGSYPTQPQMWISLLVLTSVCHLLTLGATGRGARSWLPANAVNQKKISLWDPDSASLCRGNFAANHTEYTHKDFPEITIREAVPDTRSASIREFKEHSPDAAVFERVVLYVTTHLSVTLEAPGTAFPAPCLLTDVINAPDKTGEDLPTSCQENPSATVVSQYAIHSNPHHMKLAGGKPYVYAPGTKPRHREDVMEWQIVLAIMPTSLHTKTRFRNDLLSRASAGTMLHVPIPYRRYNVSETLLFNATISLSCIYGWDRFANQQQSLSRFRFPRSTCSSGASGALLSAGGALHGTKAKDAELAKEVAHFALRGHLGPVSFDTVAVPVIPKRSVSQIMKMCGGDVECEQNAHKENTVHLQKLAEIFENELAALNAPEFVYEKTILVPVCRLGSHVNGREAESPCAASFWSGQYVVSNFMYTLLSSEFRWAVMHDIDEYLGPVLKGGQKKSSRVKAEALFDEMNSEGLNSILFTWLNFLFDSSLLQYLTKDVVDLSYPVLKPYDGNDGTNCYGPRTGSARMGKVSLKCDNGFGFNVHSANQLLPEKGMNDLVGDSMLKVVRSPRTWHARANVSKGSCAYAPNSPRSLV